ncbi:RHS repeat protein, partial [Ralstonia solanacearum]|nr:RHS repeat protein [Ralstonia solanacearum]MDC6213360.1 RHS repeat protein [Ralstonia solanacearum]MDC6242330.1 RHS repeat protein [Ralstonia solanacearum]MDD7803970.1 RHS repeat protein [Ralstonia solanacearum]
MIGDFAALLTGECASGYARESDGTCQPKPPVQTCPISNPVIPGVGTKGYSESSEGGSADVPVTLVYRSASMYGVANRGGGQWMSNWQRSLDTRLAIDATPKVVAQRENGAVSIFTLSGTTWAAPDIRDTLQSVTDASGKIT